MRLCFVHPFLSEKGGAQLALQWLLKGLAEGRRHVRLCVARDDDGSAEELQRHQVDVQVWRGKTSEVTEMNPFFLQWLGDQMRKFDVAIAGNYPSTLWLAGAQSITREKIPLVWNCNEPPRHLYEETLSSHFLKSPVDPKFYFPWTLASKRKKQQSEVNADQAAVKAFRQIVSISQQTADWVEKIYKSQSRIIPLGVGDMAFGDKQTSSEFTYLAPAGFEPIKNYKTILQAFHLLTEKLKETKGVKLILVGDGPGKETALALTRRLKLKERVTFVGRIPRADLIQLYHQCDVVLFVPLDEPFGLISCEAGIAAKPAIMSNHGGPSEVVVDQVTGYLVNPLSPEDISEKMLELFRDRDRCAKMGEAARLRIEKHFAFPRYLEEYEKLLAALMNVQVRD